MENSTENTQSATPKPGSKYRKVEAKPGRASGGIYLPDSRLEEAALGEHTSAAYQLEPVDLRYLPIGDLITGALCAVTQDESNGDGRDFAVQFIQALGVDLKCLAAVAGTSGAEGEGFEFEEVTGSDFVEALTQLQRRARYGAELLSRINIARGDDAPTAFEDRGEPMIVRQDPDEQGDDEVQS